MSAEDLAQVLARFKAAGGDAFVDEPALTLLSKFAVYRLFEKEWPQMFKRAYTRQSPERLQQQINALRAADRSALVSVSHELSFAAIRAISMPNTTLPNTYELTVNRRQTGHVVKEYATHAANVDDIHSGFKSLPANGFLLVLADSSTVDSMLISPSGRHLLSASPETIQNSVLQQVESYSQTRRADKISDLCSLLSYSGVAMTPRLDKAFKDVGLIETEKDINEVIPKKSHLAQKLTHLAGEHRIRCHNVDQSKLIDADYDVDKVAFEVPEISTLTKKQIKGFLTDIAVVKPLLDEHKLNLRGQQQSLVGEVKTLLTQRGNLMDFLNSQTYYADNRQGKEASHVSRSLRNMSSVQLRDYKIELEGYIAVLSRYQYNPEQQRVKKPAVVAYY